MSANSIYLSSELRHYLQAKGVREHPVLCELRAHTNTLSGAMMQISPEQGQFMAFLIRALGLHNILEVGTFTGYSALVMALALPEGGRLITCDRDDNTMQIAETFWEKAGVRDRITPMIGSAVDTLRELQKSQSGQFDFVFIDADKSNYDAYYEFALSLLRRGGLIAIDNVLWDGAVVDLQNQAPSTVAIRALNDKISKDPRVDISMIPIGDGLTLARKVG